MDNEAGVVEHHIRLHHRQLPRIHPGVKFNLMNRLNEIATVPPNDATTNYHLTIIGTLEFVLTNKRFRHFKRKRKN